MQLILIKSENITPQNKAGHICKATMQRVKRLQELFHSINVSGGHTIQPL